MRGHSDRRRLSARAAGGAHLRHQRITMVTPAPQREAVAEHHVIARDGRAIRLDSQCSGHGFSFRAGAPEFPLRPRAYAAGLAVNYSTDWYYRCVRITGRISK